MKDFNQPQQSANLGPNFITKKVWVSPAIMVIRKGQVESGSTTGGFEGQPTIYNATNGGHYSS